MEKPLFRLWLTRLAIAAIPFLVYFAWRRWETHRGREVGAIPWGWLIGAGALLAAISLMATVVFHPDNRGRTYVPPTSQPDGSVSSGRFE